MFSLPKPQKSLRAYLDQYAEEHQTKGNKISHMIGIPLIALSLPTAVVAPPVGAAMFVGGWACQYVGHYVFEKNKPAFYADPYYLLVGPVWVAIEFAELAGIALPESLATTPRNAVDSDDSRGNSGIDTLRPRDVGADVIDGVAPLVSVA